MNVEIHLIRTGLNKEVWRLKVLYMNLGSQIPDPKQPGTCYSDFTELQSTELERIFRMAWFSPFHFVMRLLTSEVESIQDHMVQDGN